MTDHAEELSPARQRLLDSWLRGDSAGVPTDDRISRRSDSAPVPLTFQQLRIWFLDQLVPGSPAYNGSVVLRLDGPLDLDVLEQSIATIVRRHSTLRTTFPAPDGEPTQMISETATIPLIHADLTALPQDARDAETRRRIEANARTPFDLERGPVMRTTVLTLGPRTALLLLAWSHLVIDGWSGSLFSRELVACYPALRAGRTPRLPTLTIDYADYAAWQRTWLSPERLSDLLSYWRTRLADAPTMLDIPTDRPRPAIQSFRGDTLSFTWSEDLTGRLRRFAARENVTTFAVILAAFQVVSTRYSGQTDLLIGTPIANRSRPETENIIGFFANTLVLRTDTGGDPTFRELLGRVRDTTTEAFEHQDLPFEKLVDELRPERSTSINPLFQVMYTHQNTPEPALRFTDELSATTVLGRDSRSAKFDLWLSTNEMGEQLYCELEFATDLFDTDTVERLVRQLRTLLDSAIDHPTRPISRLELVDQDERRLLERWNDTRIDYSGPQLLHRPFEQRATESPDTVAVVFDTIEVTYRDLDARANQLAHRLRDEGVGRGTLVGVCLPRSVELVIGLLAVLKAGAAYVPLDPDHPRERLRYLVDDAAPPVVLTSGATVDRVEGSSTLRVDDPDLDRWPVTRPRIELGPFDRAYVIYTSGSTGLPKGAVNSHGAVHNRLAWMQDLFGLVPTERVLQKTPFGFDVSVWELFWPLSVGATMVVARPDGHYDVPYLTRMIDEQAVTTVHFVPSMLRMFLEHPRRERGPRLVICSGEALSYELQQRFFEIYPDVELHNLYGPTEAAVDVTHWRCAPTPSPRSIPIGAAVANTTIRVLGPGMDELPRGVPGELCIGGVQVAQAYHRRAGLTAAKFVADPFSERPGARMYRTGDLVRRRTDGAVEFLGRIDAQIKLRGLRIEPGEIESTLSRLAEITHAAVTVHRDGGDDFLVAYVVLDRAAARGAIDNVDQWAAVFDTVYADSENPGSETSNFAGWNSSYTNTALDTDDMRAWVAGIVERTLALKPRRVLEIGCGTGLLLFGIAPSCEHYIGTDIAREGIDFIAERLRADPALASRVTLDVGPAHDLSAVADHSVDTVVLNSVVQYFPDIDYLFALLRELERVVEHGGRIVIGDIRSAELLAAFHTEVQLHKADSSTSLDQVRKSVTQALWEEAELAIDQSYFLGLPARLSRVGRVEIQLKRGAYRNELSRFRYDVVLHLDRPRTSPRYHVTPMRGVEEIERTLIRDRPEALAVTAVPNARISAAAQILDASRTEPRSVDDLRSELAVIGGEGVDPDLWWDLGERHGYRTEVRWSQAAVGACDVLFSRPDAESTVEVAVPRADPASYANRPDDHRLVRHLLPSWRKYLTDHLPSYMVPSVIVSIPELPLTASGKCDRSALPAPPSAPEPTRERVEPATATEHVLAAAWAAVLGRERIGVTDDYFDIGGDSIRAIRVIAAANREGLALTPTDLFRNPTVRALAVIADSRADTSSADHMVADGTRAADEVATHPEYEDVYRLSPYQDHMMRRMETTPDRDLFFVQRVQWMPTYDLDAFDAAWRQLGEIFPILRTTFHRHDPDRPTQEVHRSHRLRVVAENWRKSTPEERDRRLRAYLDSDRRQGFPLDVPEGVRILIAEIDDERSVSVMSFSYLRLDGWTVGLLSETLRACYEQARMGAAVGAPHTRTPYRVFVDSVLDHTDTPGQRRYWREVFADFPGPTSLLATAPRPADPVRARHGLARRHVYLPGRYTDRLLGVSNRLRCTPNALVGVAWASLLARYCGSSDVTFGVLVTGRMGSTPGIDTVCGPTLNVLPFRVRDLRPSTTIADLVHTQSEAALTLSEFEHTPPGRAVEFGDLPTDTEPFDNYLIFQNLDPTSFQSTDPVPIAFSRMGYPVRVEVFPGVRIAVAVTYHREELADESAAMILEDFESLIDLITANPRRSLGSVWDALSGTPRVRNPTHALIVEGEIELSQIDLAQPPG